MAALLLLSAGGARAAADGTAEGGGHPPDAVILLAASWCAPCRGEIAALDTIAAAAAPRAVHVLVVDEGPRARAMTRDVPAAHRWEPGPASRGRVVRALMARTPGLPYAAATDARGRVCAEHGGGLDAAAVRALALRCGR